MWLNRLEHRLVTPKVVGSSPIILAKQKETPKRLDAQRGFLVPLNEAEGSFGFIGEI
jgi:hypothetical protein